MILRHIFSLTNCINNGIAFRVNSVDRIRRIKQREMKNLRPSKTFENCDVMRRSTGATSAIQEAVNLYRKQLSSVTGLRNGIHDFRQVISCFP